MRLAKIHRISHHRGVQAAVVGRLGSLPGPGFAAWMRAGVKKARETGQIHNLLSWALHAQECPDVQVGLCPYWPRYPRFFAKLRPWRCSFEAWRSWPEAAAAHVSDEALDAARVYGLI